MENIKNWEMLLSVLGTILSLLLTCLICFVKIARSSKQRKAIKDNIALLDAVAPLMEIAETFTHYTGAEKKEYVLTKINQFAIENGLQFNAEEVSAKIEELIKLSLEVNAKVKESKEKNNG